MKKHIDSVHDGSNPFKCEICEYSFSRKGSLKSHVASVHEENMAFVNKADSKSIR